MIGNNSCGATAQRAGKVVDNIARLEVLPTTGRAFGAARPTRTSSRDPRRRATLGRRSIGVSRKLRDEYADEIRRRYPDIPRRVSGYNLDSLLPEHRFDVAGLLVGSESTLVTVLHAELELLPVLKERTLVVLGFPDIMKAADAVPAILPHEPIALEGIDERLIHDEQIKRLNPIALEELPEGNAFLMVQFGGDPRRGRSAAEAMLHALGDSEHEATVAFLEQPEQEDELWRVREGGLGATAHVPGHPDTWEGWEDSAVAPDRLGDYLRDLKSSTRSSATRTTPAEPLRPLRAGLRAHAHPVRPHRADGVADLPAVPRARRETRRLLRRVVLRRARRRPEPRRAARSCSASVIMRAFPS